MLRSRNIIFDAYKILQLGMAKSTFEYVKTFELEDTLLPNSWIVVRLDGKCFHQFAEKHNFNKPNDIRAIDLMNRAALSVFNEFQDVSFAFGQSDEYSFILKKQTCFYKRRAAKILSTVVSKFTSSYVFYWNNYFIDTKLEYPPVFDGRTVVYPSDRNLVDYLSWRQADVHVNNLYNTTFWNLVIKGNLTPAQAEKRLSGTLAADKNEILFKEFNLNYNNEPNVFKKGTILLRKIVNVDGKNKNVIVNLHADLIKKDFWDENSELLSSGKPAMFILPLTMFVKEQLNR